jgi:hypothetical protein
MALAEVFRLVIKHRASSLAATVNGKLSSDMFFRSALRGAWLVRISLVQLSKTRMSRLRNFGTEPRASYCYEFQTRQSLGKPSQARTPPPICTLASFLKPRWSQEP